MPGLRWLFIVVFMLSLSIPLLMVTIEGHMKLGNHTWIVQMAPAPFWSQPSPPSYQAFAKDFHSSEDFPREGTPGVSFYTLKRIDWSLLYTLTLLWPISLIFGCFFLGFRGQRRDLLLHCVGCGGIGVTIGCIVFMILWQWPIIYSLEFTLIAYFAGALIGGILYRLMPPKHNTAEQSATYSP